MPTSPRKGTSPRTWRIYNFVIAYMTETAGRPPSVREIVAATNICQSAVIHHLKVLEERGRIKRGSDGQARNISIPGARLLLPPGVEE